MGVYLTKKMVKKNLNQQDLKKLYKRYLRNKADYNFNMGIFLGIVFGVVINIWAVMLYENYLKQANQVK